VLSAGVQKALHVSPFMGMDQRYQFQVPAPGDTLFVRLENIEDSERVFDATLRLQRRPFDRSTMRRISWRYPVTSRRMLLLIYIHALVLRAKGVRVRRHPGVATS
jgi:DUF1365 family protein